ncbi:PIN domain-containing protein [Burkholderia cenocepacia]|uniref:PIN domain-containing protein n=1 Tax=Burkholderia cenocepacia TaxID=95486 RepID=UPI000DD73CDB|nr:PIN domain-containing protein [Burkholderia cenocepacia]
MIYVFDTSSIRSLQHFYPRVFRSIWQGIEKLVGQRRLISTREVLNEIERQAVSADVLTWVKGNRSLFTTPSADELRFVASILQIKHFQALIGQQQRLKGTPVADPFVIACAKVCLGTVVTEEGWLHAGDGLVPKPHAEKIPNVCAHFEIPCIDLEEFMHQQDWQF